VRVILDTNVVVSGLFFGGAPRRILELWREGALEWVITAQILDEYRRVGSVLGQRYPGVNADPFLDFVARRATVVTPKKLPKPATADPDDEKFFEAAVGGDVRLIVSGDKHLLNAAGSFRVQVLKPADFLEQRTWDDGK
jgi:uncharacterized protein